MKSCHLCPKFFPTLSELLKHEEESHRSELEVPLKDSETEDFNLLDDLKDFNFDSDGTIDLCSTDSDDNGLGDNDPLVEVDGTNTHVSVGGIDGSKDPETDHSEQDFSTDIPGRSLAPQQSSAPHGSSQPQSTSPRQSTTESENKSPDPESSESSKPSVSFNMVQSVDESVNELLDSLTSTENRSATEEEPTLRSSTSSNELPDVSPVDRTLDAQVVLPKTSNSRALDDLSCNNSTDKRTTDPLLLKDTSSDIQSPAKSPSSEHFGKCSASQSKITSKTLSAEGDASKGSSQNRSSLESTKTSSLSDISSKGQIVAPGSGSVNAGESSEQSKSSESLTSLETGPEDSQTSSENTKSALKSSRTSQLDSAEDLVQTSKVATDFPGYGKITTTNKENLNGILGQLHGKENLRDTANRETIDKDIRSSNNDSLKTLKTSSNSKDNTPKASKTSKIAKSSKTVLERVKCSLKFKSKTESSSSSNKPIKKSLREKLKKDIKIKSLRAWSWQSCASAIPRSPKTGVNDVRNENKLSQIVSPIQSVQKKKLWRRKLQLKPKKKTPQDKIKDIGDDLKHSDTNKAKFVDDKIRHKKTRESEKDDKDSKRSKLVTVTSENGPREFSQDLITEEVSRKESDSRRSEWKEKDLKSSKWKGSDLKSSVWKEKDLKSSQQKEKDLKSSKLKEKDLKISERKEIVLQISEQNTSESENNLDYSGQDLIAELESHTNQNSSKCSKDSVETDNHQIELNKELNVEKTSPEVPSAKCSVAKSKEDRLVCNTCKTKHTNITAKFHCLSSHITGQSSTMGAAVAKLCERRKPTSVHISSAHHKMPPQITKSVPKASRHVAMEKKKSVAPSGDNNGSVRSDEKSQKKESTSTRVYSTNNNNIRLEDVVDWASVTKKPKREKILKHLLIAQTIRNNPGAEINVSQTNVQPEQVLHGSIRVTSTDVYSTSVQFQTNTNATGPLMSANMAASMSGSNWAYYTPSTVAVSRTQDQTNVLPNIAMHIGQLGVLIPRAEQASTNSGMNSANYTSSSGSYASNSGNYVSNSGNNVSNNRNNVSNSGSYASNSGNNVSNNGNNVSNNGNNVSNSGSFVSNSRSYVSNSGTYAMGSRKSVANKRICNVSNSDNHVANSHTGVPNHADATSQNRENLHPSIMVALMSPSKGQALNTQEAEKRLGFQCPACDALLSSKQSQVNHIRICHLNSMEFPCVSCVKDFGSRIKLFLHLWGKHGKGPNVFCLVCGYTPQLTRGLGCHFKCHSFEVVCSAMKMTMYYQRKNKDHVISEEMRSYYFDYIRKVSHDPKNAIYAEIMINPPDASQARTNPPDACQARTNPPDACQARTNPPDAYYARTNPPDSSQARTNPPDARQARTNLPDAYYARTSPDGSHAMTNLPDAIQVRTDPHDVYQTRTNPQDASQARTKPPDAYYARTNSDGQHAMTNLPVASHARTNPPDAIQVRTDPPDGYQARTNPPDGSQARTNSPDVSYARTNSDGQHVMTTLPDASQARTNPPDASHARTNALNIHESSDFLNFDVAVDPLIIDECQLTTDENYSTSNIEEITASETSEANEMGNDCDNLTAQIASSTNPERFAVSQSAPETTNNISDSPSLLDDLQIIEYDDDDGNVDDGNVDDGNVDDGNVDDGNVDDVQDDVGQLYIDLTGSDDENSEDEISEIKGVEAFPDFAKIKEELLDIKPLIKTETSEDRKPSISDVGHSGNAMSETIEPRVLGMARFVKEESDLLSMPLGFLLPSEATAADRGMMESRKLSVRASKDSGVSEGSLIEEGVQNLDVERQENRENCQNVENRTQQMGDSQRSPSFPSAGYSLMKKKKPPPFIKAATERLASRLNSRSSSTEAGSPTTKFPGRIGTPSSRRGSALSEDGSESGQPRRSTLLLGGKCSTRASPGGARHRAHNGPDCSGLHLPGLGQGGIQAWPSDLLDERRSQDKTELSAAPDTPGASSENISIKPCPRITELLQDQYDAVSPAGPQYDPISPERPQYDPITPERPQYDPVTPERPQYDPVSPGSPQYDPISPERPHPVERTPNSGSTQAELGNNTTDQNKGHRSRSDDEENGCSPPKRPRTELGSAENISSNDVEAMRAMYSGVEDSTGTTTANSESDIIVMEMRKRKSSAILPVKPERAAKRSCQFAATDSSSSRPLPPPYGEHQNVLTEMPTGVPTGDATSQAGSTRDWGANGFEKVGVPRPASADFARNRPQMVSGRATVFDMRMFNRSQGNSQGITWGNSQGNFQGNSLENSKGPQDFRKDMRNERSMSVGVQQNRTQYEGPNSNPSSLGSTGLTQNQTTALAQLQNFSASYNLPNYPTAHNTAMDLNPVHTQPPRNTQHTQLTNNINGAGPYSVGYATPPFSHSPQERPQAPYLIPPTPPPSVPPLEDGPPSVNEEVSILRQALIDAHQRISGLEQMTAQISPAQMHPAQMHPAQMHPAQMHPAQMHPAMMNPAQMHPAQMHPAQMNQAVMNPLKYAFRGPPNVDISNQTNLVSNNNGGGYQMQGQSLIPRQQQQGPQQQGPPQGCVSSAQHGRQPVAAGYPQQQRQQSFYQPQHSTMSQPQQPYYSNAYHQQPQQNFQPQNQMLRNQQLPQQNRNAIDQRLQSFQPQQQPQQPQQQPQQQYNFGGPRPFANTQLHTQLPQHQQNIATPQLPNQNQMNAGPNSIRNNPFPMQHQNQMSAQYSGNYALQNQQQSKQQERPSYRTHIVQRKT